MLTRPSVGEENPTPDMKKARQLTKPIRLYVSHASIWA